MLVVWTIDTIRRPDMPRFDDAEAVDNTVGIA
jgi:hypothetical protein